MPILTDFRCRLGVSSSWIDAEIVSDFVDFGLGANDMKIEQRLSHPKAGNGGT